MIRQDCLSLRQTCGVGDPTQQKCNLALANYATQNPFDGGELKPSPSLSVHSDSPGQNGASSGRPAIPESMDGMEHLRADWKQDVVLIRHAEPIVEPDRPPSEWQLSLRGKELAHDLVACLSTCGLRRIVTSPEVKARATATAVTDVLGLNVITDDGLREVQRPWIEGNFDDAVTRYLQGNLIEGWEPIEQVVSRVVDSLVGHSGDGPIGVVTHGTAMACFVGANVPTNRALFWSDLTMPDVWALSSEGITRLYHLET